MDFFHFKLILLFVFGGVSARRSREIRIISTNNVNFDDAPFQSIIIQDALPSSNKIALKHCQNQFRWDRWNCPSSDFLIKKNSKYFDRETVFVQSLALASLTFSIMRNCSRNNFEGCQCSVRFDNSNLNNEIPNCFDALDDLVDRITGSIDQSAISRLDAYEYARIHNIRAVRIALKISLRHNCRCTELSCLMRDCWQSLHSFEEIAINLQKMYERAVLLTYNNHGRIDLRIREEVLVYVLESPNYCKENAVSGWKGMIGRRCSRARGVTTSLSERKSCKNLCRTCGLRVRRQTVIRTKRCNCKFEWCCNVTCDICTEKMEEHYCY